MKCPACESAAAVAQTRWYKSFSSVRPVMRWYLKPVNLRGPSGPMTGSNSGNGSSNPMSR